MNKAIVAPSRSSIIQVDRGYISRHFELNIERALQGSRRCRRCASVHGRYVCGPSAAVRNEWRHTDSDVELIVHLLACRPESRPRLQAMIVLESGGQLHARAIYAREISTTNLQDGPWMLRLISEQSQCAFVFPDQVELDTSSDASIVTDGIAICGSAHDPVVRWGTESEKPFSQRQS